MLTSEIQESPCLWYLSFFCPFCTLNSGFHDFKTRASPTVPSSQSLFLVFNFIFNMRLSFLSTCLLCHLVPFSVPCGLSICLGYLVTLVNSRHFGQQRLLRDSRRAVRPWPAHPVPGTWAAVRSGRARVEGWPATVMAATDSLTKPGLLQDPERRQTPQRWQAPQTSSISLRKSERVGQLAK